MAKNVDVASVHSQVNMLWRNWHKDEFYANNFEKPDLKQKRE